MLGAPQPERGEQVSRSDLIERLSEWERGRLSLVDTAACLHRLSG